MGSLGIRTFHLFYYSRGIGLMTIATIGRAFQLQVFMESSEMWRTCNVCEHGGNLIVRDNIIVIGGNC